MTIIVKDLDKEEAWGTDVMLPVGAHVVLIDEGEEAKEPSKKGNPVLELRFVAPNGSGSIRDWLHFTEKTRGRQKQLLDAAGIKAPSAEAPYPVEELRGRKIVVRVIEEPDREDPRKMRRRVAAYMHESQAPGSDVPADDADLPF